ncbi:hypothetical protein VDP25_16915 [Winogradskyella sp. ECml5-4]|uniref:hypothetical protein n=1 Tax=Winogradskyella sp. ECml5-4 TaxID=3110975 RepID=UPI002FF14573
MLKNINFSSLINSVSYWLCFQEKIGRKFMINESSLKYPIADFFTNHHFPVDNIELEFNHPIFKKRSIDIVLKEKNELKIVFELKIASYSTSQKKEKKRIFNDLMRLYVLTNKDNIKTYFIISGYYEDFLTYFRSIENRKELAQSNSLDDNIKEPSGFYTKWFSFKKEEETIIDIEKEKEVEYRTVYDNFYKEYKIKKDVDFTEKLPQKITTKCVDVSPLSTESPLPYLTAIWEIY